MVLALGVLVTLAAVFTVFQAFAAANASAPSWALVAVSAEPGAGGRLCGSDGPDTPCDAATLRAAAARGDSCAWVTAVRLGAWPDAPLVLRDARLLAFAVVESGDGAPLADGRVNVSTDTATFPLASEDATWWRGEEEDVAVAVPVPCDARRITVTLNVEASSWTGTPFSAARTVGAELWAAAASP